MAAYTKQTWDTTSIFNPTRMNYIEQGIYNASTNIVDNLTSTDATTALSAKQGKVLNDKINGLITRTTVTGTSDQYGNISLGISINHVIVNAVKLRNTSNPDSVCGQICLNNVSTEYFIHLTSAMDNSIYGNKAVEIQVDYI